MVDHREATGPEVFPFLRSKVGGDLWVNRAGRRKLWDEILSRFESSCFSKFC